MSIRAVFAFAVAASALAPSAFAAGTGFGTIELVNRTTGPLDLYIDKTEFGCRAEPQKACGAKVAVGRHTFIARTRDGRETKVEGYVTEGDTGTFTVVPEDTLKRPSSD
jgi:hypothetical protein